MKWTYLWLASIVLTVTTLIVMIFVKLIPGVGLPDFCWLVPGIFFLLFISTFHKAGLEMAAAFRNVFRDFLEEDKTFPRADLNEYPADYIMEIDRTAEELTKAGMIVEGDFLSPGDESGLGKKIFERILHSPDGTVWAEVKRIRPNLLVRWAATIFGLGQNFQTLTDISIFFEKGNALIVSNAKVLVPKPIPGIQKEGVPTQTPQELLQSAMEWKQNIEDGGNNPARSLELEAFQKSIYGLEIYFNFKNTGSRVPSDALLKAEGFSETAIKKYRKICNGFFIAGLDVDNRADSGKIPEAGLQTGQETTATPASSSATVAESASVIPSLPGDQNSELETALKRYQSSMTSFGLAVLLSAVNVVLVLADADISFPFSAFFPTLAIVFGKLLTEESNWAIFTWIGIALAVFSILGYTVCWLLAKKYRAFILAAFVIFLLDFLLIFLYISGGGWEILVEIVFHFWVLCTLYSGVKAWRSIRRLSTDAAKQ